MTRTTTKTASLPWTGEEIAFLVANYGILSRAEIGRRLGGRSADTIGMKAHRLGATSGYFTVNDEAKAKVIALTEAGRSEAEIATELGTNRTTVRKYRRLLGVEPATLQGSHYRQQCEARMRQQCEARGGGSLVELRWEADRIEAMRMGYPPEVGTSGAKILDALKAIGAGTKAEIARATGVAELNKGKLLQLVEMGLVVVLKEVVEEAGSRRPRNVYRLARHRAQGGMVAGATEVGR